jgi:hypothetical protein
MSGPFVIVERRYADSWACSLCPFIYQTVRIRGPTPKATVTADMRQSAFAPITTNHKKRSSRCTEWPARLQLLVSPESLIEVGDGQLAVFALLNLAPPKIGIWLGVSNLRSVVALLHELFALPT